MAKVGWRQTVVALVALGGFAAGCGDDDDAVSETEATSADESTSSTTTDDPTTTTSDEGLPDEPPMSDVSASGSGCSPSGDDLPDGWWYVTLDGAVSSEMTFDLACYYTGAAAVAEAAARGDEVNNDVYVVNDNPQVRTIAVGADATASCVDPGGSGTADCSPSDVNGDWAVWLRVQDGEIDRIVEQYAP